MKEMRASDAHYKFMIVSILSRAINDCNSNMYRKVDEEEVRMRHIPGTGRLTAPDTIAGAPTAAAPSPPCVTFEAVV